MSMLGTHILAAAARAAGPQGETATRVHMGKPPEDAVTLGTLEPVLDDWIAKAAGSRESDIRMRAMFLMGGLSFSLSEVLAGPALDGIWLSDIPAAAVAARPWYMTYGGDGATEQVQLFDLWIDADALGAGTGPDGFGRAFEGLLAPLVEELHRRSRLSRAAFWREAADSLTASLLIHGKEAGREEAAMAAALQLVRQKGSKLANRQTGFIRVDLPERPDIAEWFRERGGCCRSYTSPGVEYCLTCVLRDRASRVDRLRDHLRRKHGLAP
ncbi:(2Fe-2S)-binding protein [Caenispirillum salinarum]|uniref:(2Fe-2S)-binding protein n=1 Tax=Caenispirillum salinarum TaxID=859058 RepID=UPI00384CF421